MSDVGIRQNLMYFLLAYSEKRNIAFFKFRAVRLVDGSANVNRQRCAVDMEYNYVDLRNVCSAAVLDNMLLNVTGRCCANERSSNNAAR